MVGIPTIYSKSMKAFTLIELLVVIAIIAVISAILFPIVTNAKRSAYKAVAISNLKQNFVSLTMYLDDNGHYPVLETARNITNRDIISDPCDYWRTSSKDTWPLMLGSFGYPFDDQNKLDFITGLSKTSISPLLVSIFYSDPKITPFKGNSPPDNIEGNFKMPNRALVL